MASPINIQPTLPPGASCLSCHEEFNEDRPPTFHSLIHSSNMTCESCAFQIEKVAKESGMLPRCPNCRKDLPLMSGKAIETIHWNRIFESLKMAAIFASKSALVTAAIVVASGPILNQGIRTEPSEVIAASVAAFASSCLTSAFFVIPLLAEVLGGGNRVSPVGLSMLGGVGVSSLFDLFHSRWVQAVQFAPSFQYAFNLGVGGSIGIGITSVDWFWFARNERMRQIPV